MKKEKFLKAGNLLLNIYGFLLFFCVFSQR